MDSLLATYASSDEEDDQQQQSPKQTKSNFNSQPLASVNSLSSNPKPQSSPDLIESSNSFSKSLFSKLPQPKSERSDPFSLKNNPKKIVQFRPPIMSKVIDSDDDDDDDKKKPQKKDDFIPQAPSVKSWLSSIPAPKNSGSLGALSSSGGMGRRSIVEAEVPALSSLNDGGKDTVNSNKDNTYSESANIGANMVETSSNYVPYDNSNYGGYKDVETCYSSYGPAAPGSDDNGNYGSYEGYSDYGNNVKYESKWVDRSGGNLEPEVSVAAVIQNVTRVPGKRGRNEIPREIIEVSQDELMKNRPREDQVKATGIAFGPSYQGTVVPVFAMSKQNKHNLKETFSTLTDEDLNHIVATYRISDDFGPVLPDPNDTVDDAPIGKISVYAAWFELSCVRLPFSRFFLSVLEYFKVTPCQMNPLGAFKISSFEILCRALGCAPTIDLFRVFYKLGRAGDWYTIEMRKGGPRCITSQLSSLKEWKNRFFYINDGAAPIRMRWKQEEELLTDPVPTSVPDETIQDLVDHSIPLRHFQESVLVQVGISRSWSSATKRPGVMYEGAEITLIDFLRKESWGGCRMTSFPLARGEAPWLVQMKERVQPPSPVIPAPYTDSDVTWAKRALKRTRQVSPDDDEYIPDDQPIVDRAVARMTGPTKGPSATASKVPSTKITKSKSQSSNSPALTPGVVFSGAAPSRSKDVPPKSAPLAPSSKSLSKGSGLDVPTTQSGGAKKVPPTGALVKNTSKLVSAALCSTKPSGRVKIKVGLDDGSVPNLTRIPDPSLIVGSSKKTLKPKPAAPDDRSSYRYLEDYVYSESEDSGFGGGSGSGIGLDSDASYGIPDDVVAAPFIPNFTSVRNGDIFEYKAHGTCCDFLDHLPTPAEAHRLGKMNDLDVCKDFNFGLVNLCMTSVELRKRFDAVRKSVNESEDRGKETEATFNDQKATLEDLNRHFEAGRVAYKDKVIKYKKINRRLKTKIAKLTMRLAARPVAVPGSLDRVAVNKLKNDHLSEIEKLKQTHVAEVSGLQARIDELLADQSWLVTEGPKHVVSTLHQSHEFTGPMNAVQILHYRFGCHEGLEAGYKQARCRLPVSSSPFYDPQASTTLEKALENLDHATYPYLDALAATDGAGVTAFEDVRPTPDPNPDPDFV